MARITELLSQQKHLTAQGHENVSKHPKSSVNVGRPGSAEGWTDSLKVGLSTLGTGVWAPSLDGFWEGRN